MLYDLSQAIHSEEEKLLEELSTGKAGKQTVTTFFGLMENLEIIKAETELIKKLVVINPLNADERNNIYWQDRLKCAEGESSEEIMIVRSDVAIYELDIASDQAEKAGQEKLEEAYEVLIEYIEEQKNAMSGDWQKAVLKMDFAHGRGEDIFAVLNAAEIIKRENPELYTRLLGIAPNHGPISEVTRSDLFGNAFHIALARSQDLRLQKYLETSSLPGQAMLAERTKNLTDIDVRQLPLMTISQEQMKLLEKKIKDRVEEAKDDKSKSKLLMQELVMATSRSSEYELYKLLDSVAMVELDETVKELKICKPNEFIEIIKNLPDVAIEDLEVQEIVKERLALIMPEEDYEEIINRIRQENSGWLDNLKKSKLEQSDISLNEIKLRLALWENTSRENILSPDFYNEIENIANQIEKMDAIGEQDEAIRSLVKQLLEIVGGHPDITQEEWFDWSVNSDPAIAGYINKLVRIEGKLYYDSKKGFPDKNIFERKVIRKRIKMFFTCFSYMLPTMVESANPSRFLTLTKINSGKNFYSRKEGVVFSFERSFISNALKESDEMLKIEKKLKKDKGIERDSKIQSSSIVNNPLIVAIQRLKSEERKLEEDLLSNPIFNSILKFRILTVTNFWDAVQSISLMSKKDLDHMDFRDIHEFKFDFFKNNFKKIIEKLENEEVELFIKTFFSTNNSRYITNLIFNPSDPWQLEILNLSEKIIPNDESYQKAKKDLTEQSKISESRFVQDESGRWYAESYNAESKEWLRIDT